MADDEDEDLKRAIALSLETCAAPSVHDTAIDAPNRPDYGDEEDEDIKRAIALSLETAVNHATVDSKQGPGARPPASINHTETFSESCANRYSPLTTNGLLSLDRRKMEEERLARLAKKRSATDIDEPIAKAMETAGKKMKTSHQAQNFVPVHSLPRTPTLQYPKGAIRKTWSAAHPRGDDIKIEEVLNADKAVLAVMSSFMWDLEWLFTKFNARTTKFLFVMAAGTESERQERTREAEAVGRGRIGVCFPPLEGAGSKIHSKFMLLIYEDSMRLVITSANLTPYDWGETGVLENMVFLIDLPRLDAPREKEELTFFGQELLYFLGKSNLPEASLKSLLKFDFSATKNMAFVHSV
jgi:hypothetical protein